MWLIIFIVVAINLPYSWLKIYDRCELAKELVEVHEVPFNQVAVWVCIAKHESEFNTSAVGNMNGGDSKDHGIFQISDLYWCSPPGHGWACGVTCSQLEDDDIEDDYICARRIYREHKKLSGNGFNAWAVYQPFCTNEVSSYISGCFNNTLKTEEKSGSTTTTTSFPITKSLIVNKVARMAKKSDLTVLPPWYRTLKLFFNKPTLA